MNRFIYPVDSDSFQEIRTEGKLYVDKTDMIFDIVNIRKYRFVFLARPRRFGKTLLCNTFKAYFQGQKELFEGLKIMDEEKDWIQYPVLQFDMSELRNCRTIQDMEDVLTAMVAKYESDYGTQKQINDIGKRFSQLIHHVYKVTGKKVVILFDEYDTPMMRNLYNADMLGKVCSLLRGFYQTVKIDGELMKFVFITGITKFSQMSIFSELNNLKQISMLDEYSGICGITQEELENELRPCVEEYAGELKISVDEAYALLKKNYDGYRFSMDGKNVYAPFSLLNALNDRQTRYYWFESGTSTALVEHLQHFPITDALAYDGIEVGEDEFNISCENATNPMPLLYQSGYLTIDRYESKLNTYVLHFPNLEVREGIIRCLMPLIVKRTPADNNNLVRSMASAIFDGKISDALATLRAYIANIPYDIITKDDWNDRVKRESFYKLLLYMAFSMLNSVIETEVKSILGRADVVIKTKKEIFVLELKVDDSVDNALAQIDSKGYITPFISDGRIVTKCGVSIMSQQRNITHWRVVDVQGNILDEVKFQ